MKATDWQPTKEGDMHSIGQYRSYPVGHWTSIAMRVVGTTKNWYRIKTTAILVTGKLVWL